MTESQGLVVCRCEDVTVEEVVAAIRDGCATLDEIKRVTRAGMGLCQGRTCGGLILEILRREKGQSDADLRPMSVRFPLHPVSLAALTAFRGDESTTS
jgi:NAD(P)H-nitrite reductase large subunit